MFSPHTSLPLAVLLLVAPGLGTWWLSRRVVAFKDDPALAERLQPVLTRVMTLNFLAGLGFAFVVSGTWSLPLAGLSALGSVSGWYSARRVLFDERWGFWAYLSHTLRVYGSHFGYWGLAGVSPLLVAGAAPYEWIAATLLGLVLLGWALFFDGVLLTLLRSRPLELSAELGSRFEAVLARTTVAKPLVFVAGPEDAVWVQALALPARPSPRVVLSRTLLRDFPGEEVTAIFAHEVAHLENYTPAQTRKAATWALGFAAVGVLGVPVATWLGGPDVSGPATFALFFGLVVAWFLQQSSHRPQESACDRRAAELCGDPETLVRALGRLHAMSLMPRRLAPEDEVSTSHPSLASRVAAIRSASPPATAATNAPVVLATARPGTFVILEPERISWLDGVASGVDASDPAALRAAAREIVAEPYAELTELLLKARGTAIDLQARTRSGVRRAHELAPGSVATAQQALILAEGRLASVAPLPAVAGTFAALLGLLAAYVAGAPSLALPGMCALLRPRARTLMALALTLAGALLLWALGASAFRFRGFAAFLAVLSAAACLWGALRDRTARPNATALDWVAAATLLFAPLAALGLAVRQVTFEPSLYQLHQLGRSLPSASLHAFAFAGALLVGTRGRRWSAVPLLVGTAWLAVATPGLRPLFAPDPLLDEARSSPSAATREVEAQVQASVRLAHETDLLAVSPNATRFAVEHYDEEAERIEVRRWDAPAPELELQASSAAFASEDELILLDEAGSQLQRMHLPTAGGDPPWTLALPWRAFTVSVDAQRRTWAAVASSRGKVRRLSGVVGEASSSDSEWSAHEAPDAFAMPRASGAGVMFLTQRHDWRLSSLSARLIGKGAQRLFFADADGSRLLASSAAQMVCDASPASRAVVCAVGDDRQARVWAFDPAAGARRAFGSLAIRSPRVAMGPDGAFAVWDTEHGCGQAWFAVLVGGELVRVSLRPESCRHLETVALGPEFAVLVCRDHRTPTDEAGPKAALLVRLPTSSAEKR
ncbi:MAG: M48 family metalloprotease [Myxococcales bacterium]